MDEGHAPNLARLFLRWIISAFPFFAVMTWLVKSANGQQLVQDGLVGLVNVLLQPVPLTAVRELATLLAPIRFS